MDNLARAKEIDITKESGRRVEFIDISKPRPGNWQYVDVDKLENRIRAEETAKWIAIRKRERDIKKLRREAFWSTFAATLMIRLIGLAIIIGGNSLGLYLHIGEISLVAWPMGILFVLCPGHNNIEANIQEYIKKNYKEDINNVRKD